MDKFYTASELAKKIGVTPQTIYNWVDSGILTGFREKRGKSVRVLIDKKDANNSFERYLV